MFPIKLPPCRRDTNQRLLEEAATSVEAKNSLERARISDKTNAQKQKKLMRGREKENCREASLTRRHDQDKSSIPAHVIQVDGDVHRVHLAMRRRGSTRGRCMPRRRLSVGVGGRSRTFGDETAIRRERTTKVTHLRPKSRCIAVLADD